MDTRELHKVVVAKMRSREKDDGFKISGADGLCDEHARPTSSKIWRMSLSFFFYGQ